LAYSAPERFDQSVRSSTHAPSGMRPCRDSQASSASLVSRKSGLAEASREQSITTAGATNFSGGIVSVVLLGKSLPLIQCTGASKCVPVCSFIEMLFQYQAGPRSS
jgi:hypothetical protein